MEMKAAGETAIIYTRVSSERQIGNASLNTQEKTCRAYCEKNGWQVVRVFCEEGESAKTANRPQLLTAIEFCKSHKPHPNYFVVYAVDRFARNEGDHHAIKRTLKKFGTALRSATQPLGDSPAEKLMETVEGLQFANGTYRTTSTCLLFNLLQVEQEAKERLVAIPGLSGIIFKIAAKTREIVLFHLVGAKVLSIPHSSF